MSVCIFSIAWQEARMVPWFLRHYTPWVDKIVVWLEFSFDKTEALLRQCPKVDVRKYPYRGLDDEVFITAVNEWTQEARGKYDWVAFVDMDELLYHPDMPRVLREAKGELFPSTGYALINPGGWPEDDGHSQIYDLVKTGARQPNYDKQLLHRSCIDIEYAIGRHTYPPVWPKHRARMCPDVGIKLLHLHYVGGVEDSALRNARNYKRAVNKKYAWNFDEQHNMDPNQGGSVAWVKRLIDNNELVTVV